MDKVQEDNIICYAAPFQKPSDFNTMVREADDWTEYLWCFGL